MSEQSLKCAIFLSIIKEIPWEWNLRRKFLALVAAATAALKHQSGKAERRMIFRCQNLRWRTNTRLRILHPHDQFKSLLECGVWSCVFYWQKRCHLEISRKCTHNYLHLKSLLLGGNFQLKFMFYKKNTKIWRNLLLTLKFQYYISSNKKIICLQMFAFSEKLICTSTILICKI